MRRLPGLGDVVAGVLLVMWVLLDGASIICGLAKNLLVRRWARELVGEARRFSGSPPVGKGLNAAGLGGTAFSAVAHVSWGSLYQQCDSPDLRGLGKNERAVIEFLFFAYLGPLEAWCEKHCAGTFYLWADDRGVNRVFTDPTDHMLWSLTFDGPMPSMRELGSLKLVANPP